MFTPRKHLFAVASSIPGEKRTIVAQIVPRIMISTVDLTQSRCCTDRTVIPRPPHSCPFYPHPQYRNKVQTFAPDFYDLKNIAERCCCNAPSPRQQCVKQLTLYISPLPKINISLPRNKHLTPPRNKHLTPPRNKHLTPQK